jgi:surfeit locus 1 family protein
MNPMHKRWLAVAAGVTVALLTARLGVWQLDRAADKTARADQQRLRASLVPWEARDWPCVEAAELPAQRPVRLRGRWLNDRTVFLDNRPMGGQPGFVVVTPLKLSQAACSGAIVLVQRGWWPRHAQDRQRLPDWPDRAEEFEVQGVVSTQVSQTYALGDEPLPAPAKAGPLLRQNADAAFWRGWLGQSPLPGVVLQGHPEAMTSATDSPILPMPDLRRDWPPPDTGVDKHRAYAAQWFALSALVMGLTLWFAWLRPRRASLADAT